MKILVWIEIFYKILIYIVTPLSSINEQYDEGYDGSNDSVTSEYGSSG